MFQDPSNNQEIISVSDINNLAKGLLEKDLSSGELDKKLLMRFGKEPSIETSYGYKKALFIR